MQVLEIAFAAQDFETGRVGVVDDLIAADDFDAVNFQPLIGGIEAGLEAGGALGAGIGGDEFGAAREPGALGPAEIDLGVVEQGAKAIGDEVRVGGRGDVVGREVGPSGNRRTRGAFGKLALRLNWRGEIAVADGRPRPSSPEFFAPGAMRRLGRNLD
jgi:hypothetical protein